MNTKISQKLAVRIAAVSGSLVGALAAVTPAHAAIDTTVALAGVSDAQAAVITVMGAMITFAAARYGLKKVLGLLGTR